MSVSAQVIVSELGWSGSDLSTADEWLELALVDPAGPTQSLSGWTLYSGSDAEPMIRFGAVSLSGAIVIANYAEAQSRLLLAPGLVTTAVSLSNIDLRLELRRPDGSVADSVALGDHPPGRTGASGNGWASAERLDPLQSGTDAANWRTADTSLGFDAGAPLFGTPGIVVWLSESIPSSSSAVSSASSFSSLSSASSGSGEVLDGAELVTSSSSSFSSQEASSALSVSSSSSSSSSTVPSSSSSVTSTRTVPLFGRLRITEVMADPEGSDDGEWIEVGNLSAETIDIAGVLLQRRGFSRSYRFIELFGSGATLEPDQHLLIPRTDSLITLPNAGGEIVLTDGEEVIDSFAYPAATEGISSGLLEGLVATFCSPTPGTINHLLLPSGSLLIQGGALSGVGRVSLNVAADLPDVPGSMTCRIDFGDGSVSDSCNPPTHTFASVGSYDVTLVASTSCGEITAPPLSVSVFEEPIQAAVTTLVSASIHSSSSSSSEAGQRSCSPSAATGVSIAGALPNPASDDEEAEQIILQNDTARSIDLCGWVLDDGPEGSRPFRLDGIVLGAMEKKILLRPLTGIALNNDGDSIRLFRPGDPIPISEVLYESASQEMFIGPAFPTAAMTVEDRIPQNFIEPYLESKKSPSAFEVRATSSANEGDIIISEILSHPVKGEPEWIELENVSASTIDLSGWILDDDSGGGSKPWLMPRDTLIEPGEFLVLTRAETKLSLNDGGDSVELRRGSQVMDAVDLPALKAGVALALMTDGEWCQTSESTRGRENTCLPQGALQPKDKTKKSESQKLNTAPTEASLLASLQSGQRRGGGLIGAQETGSYGWIVWILISVAMVGGVAWAWLHLDEWRWKLQPEGK